MDSHLTCILWHSSFNVRLETQLPVLIMEPESWQNMEKNEDYEKKRMELDSLNIAYNEWILRLTSAIDQAHCEVSSVQECFMFRMPIWCTQSAESLLPIQLQQLRIYFLF